MKKSILTLVVLFSISVIIIAQTPNSFKYQAVARTASGDILANESVKFTISILQGAVNGTSVYSEIHNVTTNQFGLVNFNIGEGTDPTSEFSYIDWATGTYYIEIKLNDKLIGTSQLLSVPYAKYADISGHSSDVNTKVEGDTLIIGSKYYLIPGIQELEPPTPNFTCGIDSIQDIDGNWYMTVLIGDQCWTKTNLNVGNMISVDNLQQDNSVIEKYCYNNELANCDKYGGFYQLNEAMLYMQDTNGICPSGWHIPTDDDWKNLELYLGIDESELDDIDSYRGTFQGDLLKVGNSTGFDAIMTGYVVTLSFYDENVSTFYWSSTKYSDSPESYYTRELKDDESGINREIRDPIEGFSIRCIKDE